MIKTNKKQKYLEPFQVIEAISRTIPHVMVELVDNYTDKENKVNYNSYLFYDLTNSNTGELIQDNERLAPIQQAIETAYPKALTQPIRVVPQYAPEQAKRYLLVSTH